MCPKTHLLDGLASGLIGFSFCNWSDLGVWQHLPIWTMAIWGATKSKLKTQKHNQIMDLTQAIGFGGG